jgi:hypothetical protein
VLWAADSSKKPIITITGLWQKSMIGRTLKMFMTTTDMNKLVI